MNMVELNNIGFINHPDGEHYVRQLIQANFDSGFHNIESLRISGYINQLNQILLPVAKGLGYTVLPEKTVSSFPQQADIHVVATEQAVCEGALPDPKEKPASTQTLRPFHSANQIFAKITLKKQNLALSKASKSDYHSARSDVIPIDPASRFRSPLQHFQ